MVKSIKGVDCKAGFKLETAAYGSTPIALGAGNELPFLTEGIALEKQITTDNMLDGSGALAEGELTRKLYKGPITNIGSFSGATLTLLACVMGSGSANVSGSAVRHTLELDSTQAYAGNNVKHYGTLCIDKDTYIAEYKSFKPSKATLTFTPDANLVIAFDGSAYSFDEASAINTDSSLWTELLKLRIKFQQMDIFIAPCNPTKGVWDNDDRVCVSELVLPIDRAPSDIITNCSAPYGAEPVDGVRDVRVTFTVPTWGEDDVDNIRDFTTEIEQHTKMMMMIILTGDEISAGKHYQFICYVPSFRIIKGDVNVSGPDLISVTYECEAKVPTDATIKLMHLGKLKHELVIEIINTDNEPYLS